MKQQVGPIFNEGLCKGKKEGKKVALVPEFKVKRVILSWRDQSSKAGIHPVCCYGDRNDMWRVCELVIYHKESKFPHSNRLEPTCVHKSELDICCIFLLASLSLPVSVGL